MITGLEFHNKMKVSGTFSFEGVEFTIDIEPWPLNPPHKTSVVVTPERGYRVLDGDGLTVFRPFGDKKAFFNIDPTHMSFRIEDSKGLILVEETIRGMKAGDFSELSEIRFHSEPEFAPSTTPEFVFKVGEGKGKIDLYHYSGYRKEDAMRIAQESYVYRIFKLLS